MLKLVNWFGYAGTPVVVLLAVLGFVTKAFIIVGIGMAAVITLRALSLRYARRVRAAMDARLNDLQAREVLGPDEVSSNQRDDLEWAVEGPPIGLWRTAHGSFDMMMQDALWLAPDGTGYLRCHSAMRDEETVPVRWKHLEKGTLAIDMVLPDDDPTDEPDWETVRYRSTVINVDAGGAAIRVLCNVSRDERLGQQFWNLVGPIAFVSSNSP
jgi:hypothetical protein